METRRVMRCLKRQIAKTVLFTARFHCFTVIECFNFFFCKNICVQKDSGSTEVRPSWIRKLQQQQEGKQQKGNEPKQGTKDKGKQEVKKTPSGNSIKKKPAPAKENGEKKQAKAKEDIDEKSRIAEEKACDGKRCP